MCKDEGKDLDQEYREINYVLKSWNFSQIPRFGFTAFNQMPSFEKDFHTTEATTAGIGRTL